MALPKELLQWLYTVLQNEYHLPLVVYQDVSLILSIFNDFKVKTDIYINEAGSQKLLLQLFSHFNPNADQTFIPNFYVQSINVLVYLPHSYPAEPPIIYIKPIDSSMLIRPNNYLNTDGRFFHPLLANWVEFFGSDVSNDGKSPKDNRLLKLLLTVRELISKGSFVINKLTDESSVSVSLGSLSLREEKESIKSNPPPLPPKVDYNGVKSINSITRARAPASESVPASVSASASSLALSSNRVTSPGPPLPMTPTRQKQLQQIQNTTNSALLQLLEPLPSNKLGMALHLQSMLIQLTENHINEKSDLEYIQSLILHNTPIIKDAELKMNDCIKDVSLFDIELNTNKVMLFKAPTDLHEQIYQLETKTSALLDTLNYLDGLFVKGKIDFNMYLKKTREISEEIAQIRILSELAWEKTGL